MSHIKFRGGILFVIRRPLVKPLTSSNTRWYMSMVLPVLQQSSSQATSRRSPCTICSCTRAFACSSDTEPGPLPRTKTWSTAALESCRAPQESAVGKNSYVVARGCGRNTVLESTSKTHDWLQRVPSYYHFTRTACCIVSFLWFG